VQISCILDNQECPIFDGCPVGMIQCANLDCVTNISLCLCNNGSEVLCYDGSCRAPEMCQQPAFINKPLALVYAIETNINNNLTIVNGKLEELGFVIIPSGSFVVPGGLSSFEINSVPDEVLFNSKLSDGSLATPYILTSVADFTISSDVVQPFQIPVQIIMTLAMIPNASICLATLNASGYWECVGNVTVDGLQLSGFTHHFSTYSFFGDKTRNKWRFFFTNFFRI